MYRITLAALSVALWSSPPHASASEGITGHDLSIRCQAAKDVQAGKTIPRDDVGLAVACVNLLTGFAVGWNVHEIFADKSGLKPFMICFPRDLTGIESTIQMTNIIVKYLDDNPTESHQPWDVIFMRAFQQYYPCEK